MSASVFIDGEAGTTGLQLRARLEKEKDIYLIQPDPDERKDPEARARCLARADLAVLCLPSEAARDAVALAGQNVKILDASQAHRTDPGWVYGMPEYAPERAGEIARASRVSNPGCYAMAGVALLRPLIKGGLMAAGHRVSIHAVSGYTGGGKAMIASYEDRKHPDYTESPARAYGFDLEHPHVEEIRTHAGLDHAPLFTPMVVRARQGMLVQIPLHRETLTGAPAPAAIHAALADAYAESPQIEVASPEEAQALRHLDATALARQDIMRLYVISDETGALVLLCALLDNLGKGAAGTAVQNIRLMLGA